MISRSELKTYRDMMKSTDVEMWDLCMNMLSEKYGKGEIDLVPAMSSSRRRTFLHISQIKRVYLRDETVYVIGRHDDRNIWTIHPKCNTHPEVVEKAIKL